MPNSSDDEHDEDDLPNISNYIVQPPKRPTPTPTTTTTTTTTSQRKTDENLLDRFQRNSFNRSIESWQQLHQKSLQVLNDNDDEYFEEEDVKEFRFPSYPAPPAPVRPPPRAVSTPSRVFNRQSSPSPPPPPRPRSPPAAPPAAKVVVRPRSPSPPRSFVVVPMQQNSATYEQKPLDSRKTNSKWEVRLPHLISVSVGPDRQSLERTRRHTTEIVYQKANGKNEDFYLSNSSTRSNGTSDERMKINPLVKQLREKFNRIAEKTAAESVAIRNPPTLRRVLSLTGRGTNENNITKHEWAVKPSDALLPRRHAPEMKTSRTTLTNGRTQRTRQGPPVSYPKQYVPPPSTITIVKQLIDSGATLIYDSSDRNSTRQDATNNSLYKFPSVDLNRRIETLKETNLTLTGRQMSSNVDEDDYATITPQIRQETNDDNDQSDQTISRHGSHSDVLRQPKQSDRTVSRQGSHSDVLRQPTQLENNEDTAYYAVFDIKP